MYWSPFLAIDTFDGVRIRTRPVGAVRGVENEKLMINFIYL